MSMSPIYISLYLIWSVSTIFKFSDLYKLKANLIYISLICVLDMWWVFDETFIVGLSDLNDSRLDGGKGVLNSLWHTQKQCRERLLTRTPMKRGSRSCLETSRWSRSTRLTMCRLSSERGWVASRSFLSSPFRPLYQSTSEETYLLFSSIIAPYIGLH